MQQTSGSLNPTGVTGTTAAVTVSTNAAVKSEEKKEVVGNYFALPKGTYDIIEFLEESLSKKQASTAATTPASSSSTAAVVVTPANTEAAVQESEAKYMSFLNSKCPKPSSKNTFKDALELDLAHQVCYECSDNIGRQQRMIKEIRDIQQQKNKTTTSSSGSSNGSSGSGGNKIVSPTGESAASSVTMEDMFDPFSKAVSSN